MHILDKDDVSVLNVCAKYLARTDESPRHDFGGLGPGNPRARICEAWRFPIVDSYSDGVDQVASYAFNEVTFVYGLPWAPRPAIDLLLALPRPKIMRRLWAQLAALGVGRIVLTNAERVERNYFDTHVLTPACYRPLLIDGLQQARDTRLPRVSIHRRLKVLIEDEIDGLFDGGLRIAADPAHGEPISEVIGAERGVRILLAIGPEGGWTEYERTLLAAHGFHPAGLGPRTLRSDTACIALLALAHAARGSGPPPAG